MEQPNTALSNQQLLILNHTIKVYEQYGITFTMDDLAKELHMSKKTIYKFFPSKEALFLVMVDYLFDGILAAKLQVYEDQSLPPLARLEKLMKVMPVEYEGINFELLHSLESQYPTVYQRVVYRLESGWEPTLRLMEECQRDGLLRPVSVMIVKTMMESALETFFKKDVLVQNQIRYNDALDEVVKIILEGIKK